MNIFDNTLIKIYNLLERIVQKIEGIIGKDFISSLTKMLESFHSPAVLISTLLVFISGAKVFFGGDISYALYVAIAAPIGLLVLSYFAESFHSACEDLITSNETTLSNSAFLRFAAVLNFLLSLALFIGGIISLIKGLDIGISIGAFISAFFLLLSTAPLFNPTLLNVIVTKESTSGEDFIALLTINLKSLVFFEKILSRLLIISGGVCLIFSFFFEIYYLLLGLGLLTAGIVFPVVIYLFFLFFYFFYSLLLSILAIRKISNK